MVIPGLSDALNMGKGAETIQSKLWTVLAVAASLLLTACADLTGVSEPTASRVEGADASEADRDQGAVIIRIALGSTALQKRSSVDTAITLDTLHLVLSCAGQADREVDLPVTGNINAASQVLTHKVTGLAPLRNWKLKAFSRDLADTVLHIDSTTFYVKPADTAAVSMLLAPRYSVLVARFVSTSALVASIKKLELRVDGQVVDDTVFAVRLKVFDVRLCHKYLKAGSATSVELRAYTSEKNKDLKYAKTLAVNAAASQDSEVSVQLQDQN